jgi:hypothetical protein
MGAAAWLTRASREAVIAGDGAGSQMHASAGTAGAPDVPISPAEGAVGGVFRTRLAMSLEPEVWPAGCECTAQLVLDYLGERPLTLRARDEPAGKLDSEGLANRVRALRVARTPSFVERSLSPAEVFGEARGLEREFQMNVAGSDIAMLERYLVVSGRALVVAFPEAARSVADSLELHDAELERDWFHSRFQVELPAQWTAAEELTLRRTDTEYAVTTRRALLSSRAESAWREQQLDPLQRLPGAQLVQRRPATVLNQLSGEVMTFLWNDGVARVTKLGVAVDGGEGYVMLITLPHADQAMFAQLARHVRLQAPSPTAVG